MSLLGKNVPPAERMRGCVFVEKFDSVDDVRRNGAIFGGAPTFTYGKATFGGVSDYLNYPIGNASITGSKPWSIIVRCRPTVLDGAYQCICLVGTANATQAFGVWVYDTNRIAFESSYGTAVRDTGVTPDLVSTYELAMTFPGGNAAARCFVNGVYNGSTGVATPAVVTPNIWIGAVTAVPSYPFHGDVTSVKVFDQQLSDEEVAQHYANSIYAYRSKPTIYLPMRNVDHQALQTLDTSGNNRHGVFGVGVAAPTKLSGIHGYSCDGGDYFDIASTGAFNNDEITLAWEFYPAFAATDLVWTGFLYTSGANEYFVYRDAGAGQLPVYLGTTFIASIAAATYAPYWYKGCRNVLIVSGKSGKNNVWLNGVRILTDNAVAWTKRDPATTRIGGIPGAAYTGNFTRFASWPQALTTLQVHDLLQLWQKTASET